MSIDLDIYRKHSESYVLCIVTSEVSGMSAAIKRFLEPDTHL